MNERNVFLKKLNREGPPPRGVQSVECPNLDLSSGDDLTVCGTEPRVGLCADRAEPAWDSLSSSLFAPSLLPHKCSHSLSLFLENK